ncbi:unnamed protein product, partial [Ectocarpus sp. 4 AP-2014]
GGVISYATYRRVVILFLHVGHPVGMTLGGGGGKVDVFVSYVVRDCRREVGGAQGWDPCMEPSGGHAALWPVCGINGKRCREGKLDPCFRRRGGWIPRLCREAVSLRSVELPVPPCAYIVCS